MASFTLKNIINKLNQLAARSVTPEQIANGDHAHPVPSSSRLTRVHNPKPAGISSLDTKYVRPVADNKAGKSSGSKSGGSSSKTAGTDTATKKSGAKSAGGGKTAATRAAAPAYDRQAVYDAYAAALDRQNKLYARQMEARQRARKENLDALLAANDRDRNDAMQQAYIAHMLTKRDLPQRLKSAGISGGLAETVAGDMHNTYLNNRARIEKTRQEANRRANAAYNRGVSDDFDDYLTSQNTAMKNALSKALSSKSVPALQSIASVYADTSASQQQILQRLKNLGII